MENQYGQGLYQEGVFYFTNPGKEDWTALWNNKEYTFPAKSTSPMIIANEPPENVQHIRKMFAKRYAQHVFHQSAKYKKLVKDGGYKPATYVEDDELRAIIQSCLIPLPKGHMAVKELPRDSEENYKGSKALKGNVDLNKVFEDYQAPEFGEQ